MPAVIACPHCNSALKVAESTAGTVIRCVDCKKQLTVPAEFVPSVLPVDPPPRPKELKLIPAWPFAIAAGLVLIGAVVVTLVAREKYQAAGGDEWVELKRSNATYQGAPMSYWLRRIQDSSGETRLEAYHALNAIGAPALPHLVEQIESTTWIDPLVVNVFNQHAKSAQPVLSRLRKARDATPSSEKERKETLTALCRTIENANGLNFSTPAK